MLKTLSTAERIRLVLAPLIVTAVLTPHLYQPLIDSIWHALLNWRVYNWSTFETIWTVFLYAAIEVPMTTVFIKHPEWRFRTPKMGRTKPRGMRRPSRRFGEIVLYIAPLLALDLTMLKKFADVDMEAILISGGYEPTTFPSSTTTNKTTSSSTTTTTTTTTTSHHPPKTFLIPTLHSFTLASPLQLTRALPASPPSSRRLVLELVSAFLIYDLLFFLFHLALHTLPGLRRLHAPHHAHDAQLHPQVTNRLSVFERLGLVLLANLSLNVVGSHVLARTLFVPVFVWLLVEIHCGMDVPWAYDKVLPRGWGGGARKHMRHHNVGEAGFEPFFCWWDGLWERVCGMRMVPGRSDRGEGEGEERVRVG